MHTQVLPRSRRVPVGMSSPSPTLQSVLRSISAQDPSSAAAPNSPNRRCPGSFYYDDQKPISSTRIYPEPHMPLVPMRTSALSVSSVDGNTSPLTYDAREAGMRIFATILLRSWRRKRDELTELQRRLQKLKNASLKTQTDVRSYNDMFQREHRRNNEMATQLQSSVDSVALAKLTHETLISKIISLKADKHMLDAELQLKHKDMEALNCMYIRTKSELHRSLVDQRQLKANLRKADRSLKTVEGQNNSLISEVTELREENAETEEKYRTEIEKKNNELASTSQLIKTLEAELSEWQQKSANDGLNNVKHPQLNGQIHDLRNEVATLKDSLSSTVDQKLRNIGSYMGQCQTHLLQMLRIILPAIPGDKCLQLAIRP